MRVILHAGTHKTGTTAIQRFAADNRGFLFNKGILYPDYLSTGIRLNDGHHQFAHAFSDTGSSDLSMDSAIELAESWAKLASTKGKDLLISVEALYRHVVGEGSIVDRRKNYLMRVREAFKEYPVEIILVFRRPDHFAHSLYCENIASGFRVQPKFSKWLQAGNRFSWRYFQSADIFREVFNNLKVYNYSDQMFQGDIVAPFFKELGVDISKISRNIEVRKSLSAPEAVVKNYANRYLCSRKTSRQFNSWLREDDIQRMIFDCFGPDRSDFWSSDQEHLLFVQTLQDEMMNLSREYFQSEENIFGAMERGSRQTVGGLNAELMRAVDKYFD